MQEENAKLSAKVIYFFILASNTHMMLWIYGMSLYRINTCISHVVNNRTEQWSNMQSAERGGGDRTVPRVAGKPLFLAGRSLDMERNENGIPSRNNACLYVIAIATGCITWMDGCMCIYIYIYPRRTPRNWTSVHGTMLNGEKQILIQCLSFADYSSSLATIMVLYIN